MLYKIKYLSLLFVLSFSLFSLAQKEPENKSFQKETIKTVKQKKMQQKELQQKNTQESLAIKKLSSTQDPTSKGLRAVKGVNGTGTQTGLRVVKELKTQDQTLNQVHSFQPLLIQGSKKINRDSKNIKLDIKNSISETEVFFIETDFKKRIYLDEGSL